MFGTLVALRRVCCLAAFSTNETSYERSTNVSMSRTGILVLLVEVYPEEEVNQLPRHIEYIFPCNSVYDILIQRLTRDFFDLQFHEYISEYWTRSHRQH